MTSTPQKSVALNFSTSRTSEAAQTIVPIFGRLLMSIIFLLSGFGKIVNWSMYSQFMASKGLPMVGAGLTLAIIIEIAGGLWLLSGYQARWAALILALFLVPTTLIFHNFWTVSDPMQHQDQMAHFLKNVAIIGGLLMVFAHGTATAVRSRTAA